MATLRLVLGDQLSMNLSSLSDIDKQADLIVMAEVSEEATYVRHHKKKIAFLFAAMRQHAKALRDEGYNLRYQKITDDNPADSLRAVVERCLADSAEYERVVVTKPGEWRLLEEMMSWSEAFDCEVELRDDDRFLCSEEMFNEWADGRKELRMEYFYREIRRKTDLLMDGDKPAGGEWNYDQENRKKLPKSKSTPSRWFTSPDDIDKDALADVADRFDNHFGDLEGFSFATTREGAEEARDHFMENILPGFGDYQDAMAMDEPWMWHSILSIYLNCGLLEPLDLCQRAEKEWKKGRAPLNAVEGFIRQIIGWREYVRGVYWLKMPDYKDTNALKASRDLPDFYWTGETDMTCLSQAVRQTRDNAYAHHIQRLMITGNFALIAGVHPDHVNEWYLAVYADAYEWVELPNTHGMAIYADGGVVASKPYASSGAYINRMSDYCSNCAYDVRKKTGEGACPFNYLYWDFIARNEDQLRSNGRMGLIYSNLDKKSDDEREEISASAETFLKSIGI